MSECADEFNTGYDRGFQAGRDHEADLQRLRKATEHKEKYARLRAEVANWKRVAFKNKQVIVDSVQQIEELESDVNIWKRRAREFAQSIYRAEGLSTNVDNRSLSLKGLADYAKNETREWDA